MATKADGIEVSIESTAVKANAELDKLISKLGQVNAAIISTKNSAGSLNNMASGIQRMSSAMQSMSGVGLPAFTRLAKGIERLGGVETATIQRSAAAINQMAKSLSSIGPVSQNAQQVGELAKNLSKFGYKTAGNAVENIPKLATALRQLMSTLSTAPTVSQNVIQMTNALANLASHGKAAGTASKSISTGLNAFSTSAGRARKSSTSLAAAFGKFYATYWLIIRAATKLKDAIDISSDLTEVQNVVDATFGKYVGLVEKMSDSSIQNFGMSELTVKQVASRFQAMGTAMGFAQGNMANMSIELTKLAADMASFYNVEQTDVAEDLESIFTGQTRPLRTYGLDLTEATLSEWALKRGMDADMDSMSQMEKTLLRYNYVLSNTTASQGDFLKTADTWANQVRILKQSFEQLASVVGGALINALKPFVSALNVVMQKVIYFAEKVTEALGTIFGWKYESNTAGIVTDFDDLEDSTGGTSDNLADAAKNAKKLRNTIFGYDELNVRTDNDSGSSSSGSAGTSGSSSSGGLVETDSILKKYQSEIKNLFELGETIEKSLTDAMNGIDWDDIYAKAKDFGKGLADFLNGLISPELFGATGRTIAGALNTAIYAALSFGETFEWDEFGSSVATGINEFFATFEFEELAQTLNTWVDGLETSISSALDDLDWPLILSKIGDFLKELDFDTVLVLTLLKTKFLSKGVALAGAALTKLIKDQFLSLFAGTAMAQSAAKFAGSAVSIAIPVTAGVLILVASYMWGDDIVKGVSEWVSGQKIDDETFESAQTLMFGSAEDWNKSFGTEMDTATPFDNMKKKLAELNAERKKYIADNEADEEKAAGFSKARWDSWITDMSGSWTEFKAKLSQKWDGIGTWFNENVAPWFTTEKWSTLWGNVKTAFSTKWSEITTWWKGTAIYKWWTEDVAPWFTEKRWTDLYESIKKGLSKKWDEVVAWWKSTGAYKWYEDNVKPLFEEKKWSFPGIKDGLFSIFNSAIEAVKGLWNKFATWLNEKLTFNLDTSTLIGKGISNLLGTSTIKLANLPTYANGGFPEDGLFRANRRELVGQFSNGKTAVVNNGQIIEGIAQGIKPAIVDGMMEAFMATQVGAGNQSNNQPLQMVLDGRVIAEITYNQFAAMARQGLIPKFV